MIGMIFELAGEVLEVRVNGNQVYFRSSLFGNNFMPIESLQFSKDGVVKEMPDLEGDDEWKEKALERLKEKISLFEKEDDRMNYVREELEKMGYVAQYVQKQGFRPRRIS